MVGLAAIGGITYILLVPPSSAAPAGPPNVEFEINGGEFDSFFGFGSPGKKVDSPGPEMRVKQGEIVKIAFSNVGQIPHSFRVVKEKKWDAPAVFGAAIGDATRPISPSQSGTTTFKADKGGSYFYICTVPGHVERGMFGSLVVAP